MVTLTGTNFKGELIRYNFENVKLATYFAEMNCETWQIEPRVLDAPKPPCRNWDHRDADPDHAETRFCTRF